MNTAELLHLVYFRLLPQGAVITSRAHGIDISKYDLSFVPEIATGQLDFVVQRASYRLTRDEAFEILVPGVMRVGVRGAYHYLNSDTPWRAQADKFVSIVQGYEYHFLACDFEGAYNTMGTDFAYAAWQWIHYVQERTGLEVVLYTSPSLYNSYISPSQSRYGINWNEVGLWTASWPTLPNPNGTPLLPSGRAAGWDLWQYTSKGNGPLYGVARPTACDLDVYNGTLARMRERFRVGTPEPPPPDPAEGYTAFRAYGSDCYALAIDPRLTRIHVTDTHGLLETVSHAAQRLGARYGFNADMYSRAADGLYYPDSYAVSDGVRYRDQVLSRPFLAVDRDGIARIDHHPDPEDFQAASGVRYIVTNGTKPTYLFGSEPQFTERHPRTLCGVRGDGKVIMLVVDGRTAISSGVTLSEGASLLIEHFGCQWGLDFDGGGSSEIDLEETFLPRVKQIYTNNEIILNNPSDGTERPVAQHILVYAPGDPPPDGGTMPYITGTALGTVRIRKSPGGDPFSPERYLRAGDRIEASENSAQWLHLSAINGNPVTDTQWASAGSEMQYIQWQVVGTPPPPPPPPAGPAYTVTVNVEGYKPVTLTGTLEPL